MVGSPGSPNPAGFGVLSQTGTAIPETIGRYRLLHKIARGGMAEVFAARSYGARGFEKTVALKRILPKFGHDPQFVRMMVDEAKISVLLNHPNIAQILELGEQEGDYFIVMEFVPGQSLSAIVKRLRDDGARLATLEACFVVVELLQGLHAAHIQRDASGKLAHIIHRDVSPQNTLVSFDGHVKVIDFGIARARDRLEATEVGTIKGKLRYLAPEMIDPGRFHPQGDFDHRVDVFAAGVVLWELISGRTLFPGDDEMQVYDDITDGVTPDLHDEGLCDQPLMRIIGKALERDLSRRYATAEHFADDLRAYVYRNDPAFTHKRVAATLDRLFPDEKAMLLALERGQPPANDGEPAQPGQPLAAGSASAGSASAGSASAGSASAGSASAGTRSQPALTRSTKSASPSAGEDGVVGTRALRSDKGHSAAPRRADAPTAVVDRDALDPGAALPRQRDVTVMTIVSRESVLGTAAGDVPPEWSSGDSVFSGADDATLTVSADTLRAARAAEASRRVPERAASGPVSSVPRTMPDAPAASSGSSSAPSSEASTSSSSSSSSSSRASSMSSSSRASSVRVGPRIVAVSAAVGVLLALAIVGVVEASARRAASRARAPAAVAPQPVSVVKRVVPVEAVVTVDGRPWSESLLVVPGASVVVEVSATAHVSERLTLTPVAGAPLVVQATLAPLAAPAPPALPDAGAPDPAAAGSVASVVVDDAPPASGASKPSSPPSSPSPPAPAAASGSAAPAKDRPAPSRPVAAPTRPSALVGSPTGGARPGAFAAVKGEGTLVVKASPYWGQVSVDGRALDEQTPVTVKLPPGRHDVVVSHPPRGLVKRFKVVIVSGQTVVRAVTFD